MLVLIDIEWVMKQEDEQELTQISAIRVDERWDKTSEFHVTICPTDPESADWKHIAYHGYSKEQFLQSPDVYASLAEFADWLRGDDVICSWHISAGNTLKNVWKREFGKEPEQKQISTNTYINEQFSGKQTS